MQKNFTKTKILATLGPSLDSKEKLAAVIDAGVNGLRMNFSHSDYSYYERAFSMIDEIRKEKELPIPILLDLGGPKIRTGEMSEKEISLTVGETIEITIDEVIGTKDLISTSYQFLPQDAKVGDKILIDDGLIHLSILELKEKSVVCLIEVGGILKRRKGMNLPGMKLSTPSLTDKDKSDIDYALKYGVDYVALSFVRTEDDIVELRKWLCDKGSKIQIIAKIEKEEAVENFEKILEAADGIMVARGDLGVELKAHSVPMIQKKVITRCNQVGKIVITATQMLESMITNSMPTRAEASDVANAILDGTDVVMLSGETAMGKHPDLVVRTMKDIIRSIESENIPFKKLKLDKPTKFEDNIVDAVGRATVQAAIQVEAKAIVALTNMGNKVVSISKFKPNTFLIAVTNRFETMNVLNLRFGVQSLYFDEIENEDAAVGFSMQYLRKNNIVNKGEVVVFVTGKPYTKELIENRLRFEIA